MTMANAAKRKRKTKRERQEEESQRLAAMIVSAPVVGVSMDAPGLIRDPRLAPALALWRQIVPLLQERKVLEDADRFQLALFCFWWQEFVIAADDIMRRGYSVMVKTISGDQMPRKNPSTARRDHAFEKISEMAAKFGLTPIDRYALHRAAKGAFLMEQLRDRVRSGGDEENLDQSEAVAVWDDLPKH